MKNFRDITEVKSKSATFTFGRFNPPTVGHMKLAKKMQSVSSGSDVKIFTSHGSDKKKNPLTHSQKIKFMNPMLSRGVNVSNSTSRTVFDVVTTLYDEGYREVQMVVGSDRIREFDSLLKKYNGVKARHGYYKFDSIQVVSAGQRDPDAEGDVGMSASKMRQFASLSQEKEFLDALPKGYRLGKQLYKAVQKGMGITEEFEDYMYEIMTEDNPRIPRKKGQPKGSDSHSDLYTDENPKGTIKGLKFATVEDAEKSVKKIESSGRSHAHKIQAAIAMEQRAEVMGKISAAAVYRKYINKMKEITKQKNEYYEWGTDKGRRHAQKFTPGQNVVDYVKRIKEAEDLPKKVLLYKEKMYKELKKERDEFEKKHGDKADAIMHATAMNMAKRKYGYDT